MNHIDFLPQTYREERDRQCLVRRRWVLILLTCLTLTGWGIARYKQSANLALQTNDLEMKVTVTLQKRSEMDKLRLERKSLLYQQDIQQQLAQPVAVTQVISVIGKLMPNSVGLTNISITTHRPAPKAMEDPDDKKAKRSSKQKNPDMDTVIDRDYLQIEVQGIAPDDITVANLVNAMSDNPLFDRVAMNFSRVDERDGLIMRRFRIGAEVQLDRRYLPPTQTAEVTDEK